jgi:hypothetical protein
MTATNSKLNQCYNLVCSELNFDCMVKDESTLINSKIHPKENREFLLCSFLALTNFSSRNNYQINCLFKYRIFCSFFEKRIDLISSELNKKYIFAIEQDVMNFLSKNNNSNLKISNTFLINYIKKFKFYYRKYFINSYVKKNLKEKELNIIAIRYLFIILK